MELFLSLPEENDTIIPPTPRQKRTRRRRNSSSSSGSRAENRLDSSSTWNIGHFQWYLFSRFFSYSWTSLLILLTHILGKGLSIKDVLRILPILTPLPRGGSKYEGLAYNYKCMQIAKFSHIQNCDEIWDLFAVDISLFFYCFFTLWIRYLTKKVWMHSSNSTKIWIKCRFCITTRM